MGSCKKSFKGKVMKIWLVLALGLVAVSLSAGHPKHYLVETADASRNVDWGTGAGSSPQELGSDYSAPLNWIEVPSEGGLRIFHIPGAFSRDGDTHEQGRIGLKIWGGVAKILSHLSRNLSNLNTSCATNPFWLSIKRHIFGQEF